MIFLTGLSQHYFHMTVSVYNTKTSIFKDDGDGVEISRMEMWGCCWRELINQAQQMWTTSGNSHRKFSGGRISQTCVCSSHNDSPCSRLVLSTVNCYVSRHYWLISCPWIRGIVHIRDWKQHQEKCGITFASPIFHGSIANLGGFEGYLVSFPWREKYKKFPQPPTAATKVSEKYLHHFGEHGLWGFELQFAFLFSFPMFSSFWAPRCSFASTEQAWWRQLVKTWRGRTYGKEKTRMERSEWDWRKWEDEKKNEISRKEY